MDDEFRGKEKKIFRKIAQPLNRMSLSQWKVVTKEPISNNKVKVSTVTLPNLPRLTSSQNVVANLLNDFGSLLNH